MDSRYNFASDAAPQPMPLKPGVRLGCYEILSPLGTGGMGEVYRARDTKLDRDVAVKVLADAVTAGPETLARFEREAKAVAALSHPNILAIHDFGTHDGIAYSVTELLEGETLRARLDAGPMPEKHVVDVAVQIARGLAAAHGKGIVHRDLKPENLFVSHDGHLKILDFGLAKRTGLDPLGETHAPTANHTAAGTVMGTVAYMSPEQARGLAVDYRSDIFSFGAILYELLSGRKAFKRSTATDTMAAITRDEPPGLSDAVPPFSPQLTRIVRRCLEKDPQRRYSSSQDLALDLEAFTSGAAPSPEPARRPMGRGLWLALAVAAAGLALVVGFRFRPQGGQVESLAVLPLFNASADPGLEYLGDGITDALINSLSQLPALTVMSRDSVSRYKGSDVNAQTAGRDLKVHAVLKGKFVQRAQELSVSAELVDVRNNSHLWGGQFNRKLSDIQAVQEEIAEQISSQLRTRRPGEDRKRLAARYTAPSEAYQLFLKGRYALEKRTEAPLRQSIEFFGQAIEQDPGYAAAYAGLAMAYAASTSISFLSPGDSIPKSRAAALRALEIDDDVAPAHAALAWCLWSYDWDYAGAEREFRKATSIDPRDPTAHHWYGSMLNSMGRTDESVAQLRRAHDLDPFSGIIQSNLARAVPLRPPVRQSDRGRPEDRELRRGSSAHRVGIRTEGAAGAGRRRVSQDRRRLRPESRRPVGPGHGAGPGRERRRGAPHDRRVEGERGPQVCDAAVCCVHLRRARREGGGVRLAREGLSGSLVRACVSQGQSLVGSHSIGRQVRRPVAPPEADVVKRRSNARIG